MDELEILELESDMLDDLADAAEFFAAYEDNRRAEFAEESDWN